MGGDGVNMAFVPFCSREMGGYNKDEMALFSGHLSEPAVLIVRVRGFDQQPAPAPQNPSSL